MEEIVGVYDVEFTNGDSKTVDVNRNIVDAYGHPVYLESTDARLYNWGNIISIRKKNN